MKKTELSFNTLVYVLSEIVEDGKKNFATGNKKEERITQKKLIIDLGCSARTFHRLKDYTSPNKSLPRSVKGEKIREIFLIYKGYFFYDSSEAIAAIVKHLNKISIDLTAINKRFAAFTNMSYCSDQDFQDFICLLVEQAQLYYFSSSPFADNSDPVSKIEMKTYSDLQRLKLKPLDIAKQLIANDRKLYGDIGQHAGTADQWKKHIEATPQNWAFLCRGTEIIGNWSCTFLTAEQEQAVKNGSMLGSDFTAESAAGTIGNPDGEVAVHLLNLSVNEGYHQNEDNWIMLWTTFAERLHDLAQKGIFYRSISTCLFLEKCPYKEYMKNIYEGFGFKFLTSRVGKGDIYWLDLTYEIPDAFRRIMPNTDLVTLYEEKWGKPITYRQLSSDEDLSPQQMRDICSLIFSTDRYIYDSMMTREQFRRILPLVFSCKKDTMFSLDNLFVAMAPNDRIIGLILSKKGELRWSSKYVKQNAKMLREELPDSLDRVESEYFARYNTDSDTRWIINFSTNSNWGARNNQVGIDLMAAFVAAFGFDTMRLYVLVETIPEMMVYLGNAFEPEKDCNGWSIDNRDLPCAIMVRPADPEPDPKLLLRKRTVPVK